MMGLAQLRLRPDILMGIEWELTPEEAVEAFDHRARGLERRLQIRNSSEKRLFFCVDNWHDKPRLILKERSIKQARVIAEIEAPEDLLSACVVSHGNRKGLFPLSSELAAWLQSQLYG
jgi:hypothetical protein